MYGLIAVIREALCLSEASISRNDGNFSVKGELGDIVRRLKGESVTSGPVCDGDPAEAPV